MAIVRVLGPTAVVGADGTIELPSASQRRLVAALASVAPKPVRLEWLCWNLGVTSGAVRTTVARLRRLVGPDVIHTTTTGYRLVAEVDAALACAELEQAGDDPRAIGRVLDRWAGPAFEEFRDEAWAHGEAIRLAEVHATAVERRAEALIGAGRAGEAITVLEPHVLAHPFRDQPIGLLLRALAAAGRRTEALRRFHSYRTLLADEVGTEPAEQLCGIERRIAGGWDGVAETATPLPPPVAVVRALPAALAAADGIVGRVGELAAITEAARRAESGTAQVVLVEGEAGIGKTSLIGAALAGLADSSAWQVAYGRCSEFVRAPFQPFRALVAQLVGTLPSEALTAHTALYGGDLARLVPGLPLPVPAPPHDPGEDQATARHVLFQAVVDVVRRAGSGPLVLVVDDLHWAEPTGLQLFVHLARELADVPVLMVAGYRDTGEDSSGALRVAVADVLRLGARRVALGGLAEPELAELVHARLSDAASVEVDRIARRLAAETAGNPLFAEHLLRHWVDSGSVGLAERTSASVGSGPDPSATIRDLVVRRVGVLGPAGRDVLSAAAVLGTEFDDSIVAVMTGAAPWELEDVLDRAVRSGLLAPGRASAPSRFTHAVVARSLEAELGERARRRLHGVAFDTLVARGGAAPARLAHHAERAGRPAEALRWATAAGDEAMAGLAAAEAVGWFRRALGHAVELGCSETERAELLISVGEAEYRAGHPGGLDTLHEAAALAERCGADEVLVRAALAIDPGSIIRVGRFAPPQLAIAEAAFARSSALGVGTRARLGAMLAQCLVHTDEAERRRALATGSLALARQAGDPHTMVRVATDVLVALWAPGSGRLRGAIAEEAEAADELQPDPGLSAGFAYGAFCAAVCAGDAPAAQRHARRLREIADEVDEPRARWTSAIVDAFTATMACRFRDAEASIASAHEIGTRIGETEAFTIFVGQSFVLGTFEGRHHELLAIVEQMMGAMPTVDLPFRAAHALLCVEVGRREPAEALLRDAIDRGLDRVPDDFMRSTTLLGYVVLTLELGDARAAALLLPEIEPLAGEVSFNGISSQGPIAAYVGKVLSLLGRHDEAEAHLLDALATAESFGWEYHRATTLLALAQNRFAAGGFDGTAAGWLAASETRCAEYGLAVWGRRAAALRDQVGTHRG